MESKAAKRYLARLERALTCPGADRERLLDRGRTLLKEYLAEEPDAGYEALTAAFGRPEDFAAEMLAQLPPETVEKARKRRKCIRWGAAVMVLLALVLTSVFWYSRWAQNQKIVDGDFKVVEIIRALTKEEVEEFLKD